MNISLHRFSPTKVLIVDDSAFMRSVLKRMVESEENLCVVGTAENGGEALDKVAALNPDVITLDVEMPVMDGLEILSRIICDFPRPVIPARVIGSQTIRLKVFSGEKFNTVNRISGRQVVVNSAFIEGLFQHVDPRAVGV